MWIIICIICVLLSLLRYTPQTIDVEHKLKPFNPDFIPAVGDIDAFLKVKVFFRMVELKKLKSIFFLFLHTCSSLKPSLISCCRYKVPFGKYPTQKPFTEYSHKNEISITYKVLSNDGVLCITLSGNSSRW